MLRIKLVFLAQFHLSHSSERLHGKGVDLTKVSSSTKYFRHFVCQFIFSLTRHTRHYSPSLCWKEVVLGWEEGGRRRR